MGHVISREGNTECFEARRVPAVLPDVLTLTPVRPERYGMADYEARRDEFKHSKDASLTQSVTL